MHPKKRTENSYNRIYLSMERIFFPLIEKIMYFDLGETNFFKSPLIIDVYQEPANSRLTNETSFIFLISSQTHYHYPINFKPN